MFKARGWACNYLQILNIKCVKSKQAIKNICYFFAIQGLKLMDNITHSPVLAHFFPGTPCFTFLQFHTFTPGSCPTQSQFDSWLQSCPTGDTGGQELHSVSCWGSGKWSWYRISNLLLTPLGFCCLNLRCWGFFSFLPQPKTLNTEIPCPRSSNGPLPKKLNPFGNLLICYLFFNCEIESIKSRLECIL